MKLSSLLKQTLPLFICIFYISVNTIAQDVTPAAIKECGTASLDSAAFVSQPWYGNNAYLHERKKEKDKLKKEKKEKYQTILEEAII